MDDDRMFAFTFYSMPNQMDIGYKLLSWAEVLDYSIGEMLHPYTLNEIATVYINGARFGHGALDNDGVISTQLALIRGIRNDVVIHLHVPMDDPRNFQVYGEEEYEDEDEDDYGETETNCSDPPSHIWIYSEIFFYKIFHVHF